MKKSVVKCSECGKKLLYTEHNPDTERGKIVHEVMTKGYIAKLPFLYGHSRFEFFCCKECKDKWFSKIPEEIRQDAEQAHRQLSEKMMSEEFQKGLLDGLARIKILQKRGIIK